VSEVGRSAWAGRDADVVRIAARAYERDRYLAALLAPRSLRADLIAVAAFGGEVARIPAYVREPMMGEIRLQWWREALAAAAAGSGTGHPIADAAGAAVRRHGLPLSVLEDFTRATGLRLSEAAPADDEALQSYLASTEGVLFALAWHILAGSGAGSQPELLASAGQTYGLARLVHEFPAVLAQGRTLIPRSRLDKRDTTLEALRAGARPEEAQALLAEVAAEARHSLALVAPALRQCPRPLRTALLPIALVEPYLRSQEGQRYDRPGQVADISPLTRVWRIWRAHRIGRI
jgi:phytoene synthase